MGHENAQTETDDVVVVRFSVSDPSYPFVGASRLGRVVLERMFPREAGRYACFFSVRGVDPDRIAELASTDDRMTVQVIDRYDDGGLLEFTVAGSCPALDLAQLGAIPQAAGGNNGEGWIEVEIPPNRDAAALVRRFLDEHPGMEVAMKSTQSGLTPLFSPQELWRAIDQRLTGRQREAIIAAYEAGFYKQPREATAQEVADMLGISGATFSQHRRAAERKLISIIVEDRRFAA